MFPRLETIGLPTWAAIVTAGVGLCWVLLLRRTTRLNYPTTRIYLWLLTAFPVGALGAGLLASLVRLVIGDTGEVGNFGANGMTVLGAVVACGVYSWLYIRYVIGVPAAPLLDAAAFTYPLALSFGRIGCLMNGCCYGTIADGSLGPLTLTVGDLDPSTVGGAHYAGLAADTVLWNLPIVLAICGLISLAITELAYRKRAAWRLPPGGVLLVALLADSATRFFAEFLRQEAGVGALGLNPWQTVVLGFGFLGAATLWMMARRHVATVAEPDRA